MDTVCGTSNNAKVEKTGQVYRMIESLEGQIEINSGIIARLENRLNQVISPSSPPTEQEKDAETLVPLATHLRSLTNKQRENNEQLEYLINRIQL